MLRFGSFIFLIPLTSNKCLPFSLFISVFNIFFLSSSIVLLFFPFFKLIFISFIFFLCSKLYFTPFPLFCLILLLKFLLFFLTLEFISYKLFTFFTSFFILEVSNELNLILCLATELALFELFADAIFNF